MTENIFLPPLYIVKGTPPEDDPLVELELTLWDIETAIGRIHELVQKAGVHNLDADWVEQIKKDFAEKMPNERNN